MKTTSDTDPNRPAIIISGGAGNDGAATKVSLAAVTQIRNRIAKRGAVGVSDVEAERDSDLRMRMLDAQFQSELHERYARQHDRVRQYAAADACRRISTENLILQREIKKTYEARLKAREDAV